MVKQFFVPFVCIIHVCILHILYMDKVIKKNQNVCRAFGLAYPRKVSYCDRPLSIVQRLPSLVVCQHFHFNISTKTGRNFTLNYVKRVAFFRTTLINLK